MKILVATNNPSKLARVRKVMETYEFVSLKDIGLEIIEVEEGSDLYENAEKKARVYFGKTDMPILGLDTAFVIPGEYLDPAKVKRNALNGQDENELTPAQISEKMIAFYKNIVEKRGGNVSAYFEDYFVFILPNGEVRKESGRRPVTLTSKIHGIIDPYFPLRSMYIVEATKKYSIEQTLEEEMYELQPYQEALKRILTK